MAVPTTETVVDLLAARVPKVGMIAHHHWFVIRTLHSVERWEVWQHANVRGESWGHLHRNLLAPAQGVGNGGSWRVAEFRKDEATFLASRIADAPRDYPWCDLYRYWPGPNSNTFAQWVLGDLYTLPWRGIGRRYRGSAQAPK